MILSISSRPECPHGNGPDVPLHAGPEGHLRRRLVIRNLGHDGDVKASPPVHSLPRPALACARRAGVLPEIDCILGYHQMVRASLHSPFPLFRGVRTLPDWQTGRSATDRLVRRRPGHRQVWQRAMHR